jgi:DNA-binding response OmpR family regulator
LTAARGFGSLRYLFENYALDTDRRELHCGRDVIAIAPQVFDLLNYLIGNRERVVDKDDLIRTIWQGRIVSDAALTTRLNAARNAIGDSAHQNPATQGLPIRRDGAGSAEARKRGNHRYARATAETRPPAPR